MSLAVVITIRKLRPYFQEHQIIVRTNYSVKQVLKNPDLGDRMVAWSVELSTTYHLYLEVVLIPKPCEFLGWVQHSN